MFSEQYYSQFNQSDICKMVVSFNYRGTKVYSSDEFYGIAQSSSSGHSICLPFNPNDISDIDRAMCRYFTDSKYKDRGVLAR